jgi:hypothetical protein
MCEISPSTKLIQENFNETVKSAKKLFNKNKFRTIFTKSGRLTLVEFHDENNSMMYSIKFIFDKKDSTLYISGDLGSAIFSWYSSRNSFWTLTKFAKDTGYFINKRETDTNIHVYNSDLARLQIIETYAEFKGININKLNSDDLKKLVENEEPLTEFFEMDFINDDEPMDMSTIQKLHNDVYHAVSNQDWVDDETDYGRLLGPRPIVWLTALTEIKNHPITFVPSK